MEVIAFLQSKGGVGKTTSVINIGTALALRHKKKIAVIDTDPMGSVSNWFNPEIAKFDVFTAESERDIYQVRKKFRDYDYVLIDGAAKLSVITAASVMVSDLVIIPTRPSPLDFSASGSVLDVIEAQQFNRPVKVSFLLTQVVTGTSMHDLLKNSIDSAGQHRFKTTLKQRQTYIKSLLGGGTVYDTKDGAAKGEIEAITNELLAFLHEK